jgi:hypothetical protein
VLICNCFTLTKTYQNAMNGLYRPHYFSVYLHFFHNCSLGFSCSWICAKEHYAKNYPLKQKLNALEKEKNPYVGVLNVLNIVMEGESIESQEQDETKKFVCEPNSTRIHCYPWWTVGRPITS